jgi:hypothetical protein
MLHRVPVPGEPQQQTCLWIAVGADEKIAKCIVEFARFQIFEEPDREPMTVSSAATASASLIGFLKVSGAPIHISGALGLWLDAGL